MRIWKLSFGHKAKAVPTLSKRFGPDFDVEVQATYIPDICHEPHEHVRVIFFWPV